MVLVVIGIRWLVLVDVHMFHFLLRLLLILAPLDALQYLVLHLHLPLPFLILPPHLLLLLLVIFLVLLERLEHVLVMQQRVRELILEISVFQELTDPSLNHRHLQYLVYVRSFARLLLKQARY